MSKKRFNSVRIAAASAADAGIHKKNLGSGHNGALLLIIQQH